MKLFIINLDRAEERRNRVNDNLSDLNVDFEFFSAVDGFVGLPEELKNKPDDKYRVKYRGRPLTPGEKGVYASHYLLWKKCIELNEPIAIFEDDFLPTPFFNQVIAKLPALHECYDYLRLEAQDTNFSCDMVENTSDGFQIVFWKDNLGGARGYSITPKAAKQFLSHSDRWLCAVDNFIGEGFKHKVCSFGVIPYAVYNASDMESQIQSKGPLPKVPVINKLFREGERFYRSMALRFWNSTCLKKLQ